MDIKNMKKSLSVFFLALSLIGCKSNYYQESLEYAVESLKYEKKREEEEIQILKNEITQLETIETISKESESESEKDILESSLAETTNH